MRVEKWVLTIAAGVVFQANFACQQVTENPIENDKVVVVKRVIARLNGEAILEQEFEDFLTNSRGELSGDPQPAPRRRLFQEFLTRRLLIREAEHAGTEVDDSRVEEYLQQWTAKEADEAPGLSQHIRAFLIVQKFVSEQIRPEVTVSLSEILRYYELNSEQFVMEDQAHVLEILTRDRDDAVRIRNELEDGDIRDFKERARRYSSGVTAAAGGDLGFFQRGDLPEDFEKAIFALKPGQLSEPFESDHGFHIFLVEEWIPRHHQKFFEVREEIFELLVAQKERSAVEAVLNEMLQKASIEIYDPSLEFSLKERSFDEEDKKTE
jgi:hypothetical protein